MPRKSTKEPKKETKKEPKKETKKEPKKEPKKETKKEPKKQVKIIKKTEGGAWFNLWGKKPQPQPEPQPQPQPPPEPQPQPQPQAPPQAPPEPVNNYSKLADKGKIEGGSGFKHLSFDLNKDEKINADNGVLLYMKNDVHCDFKYDGFMKIFAGENAIFQEYVGGEKGGTVVFGSSFIDDIIRLEVKENEKIRISRGSFLACTPNIKITYTFQPLGIIGIGQDQGFILPLVECIQGNGSGYIWLSSYGSFQIHELEKDDTMIIDNGLFLACNNDTTYGIEKIGKNYMTSFLNGEGFGMRFNGKCTIYTRSKNLNDFIDIVLSKTNKSDGGNNILNKVFDFGSGGKKKGKKVK